MPKMKSYPTSFRSNKFPARIRNSSYLNNINLKKAFKKFGMKNSSRSIRSLDPKTSSYKKLILAQYRRILQNLPVDSHLGHSSFFMNKEDRSSKLKKSKIDIIDIYKLTDYAIMEDDHNTYSESVCLEAIV